MSSALPKSPRIGFLAAMMVLAGCDDVPTIEGRSKAEQELRRVNARYDRAITGADGTALGKILSADYSYVTSEGEVRDKPTQIANLTSGRIRVSSPGSRDVTIRWIGDQALLIGRFPARVRVGSSEFAINERYSSLWTREGGRWRLRHEHASLISEDRPAKAHTGE